MATQSWYPLTRFEWHDKAFVASLQASQAPLAGKKIWRFHCCEGDQRCFNLWGPKKNPPKKGQLHNYQLLLLVFGCCFPFRFLRCHGTRMGSSTQFTVDRFVDPTPFPDFCFGKKWVEEWGVRSFLALHCYNMKCWKTSLGGVKRNMWETGSKSSWQQEPGIHLELEV